MKKTLVLLLTVILVMSMAVTAFAVDSPVAEREDANATSALPVVVEENPESPDWWLVAVEDADQLSEEAQKTFADSQAALKDAVPENMKTMYFFYGTPLKPNVTALTVQVAGVNQASDVAAKQYVDGTWNEQEVQVNGGDVTILGLQEGPIAIFVQK